MLAHFAPPAGPCTPMNRASFSPRPPRRPLPAPRRALVSLVATALAWPALFGAGWARPVPDYGPLDRIITHAQLIDMAPAFARQLARKLGARHRAESYDPGEATEGDDAVDPGPAEPGEVGSDTTLLWMRDYQLLYARDRDARLRAFRTLSINPNRSDYVPPDPPGGELPTLLPLIHEQGNLVVVGDRVLVGERLIDDNDGRHAEESGVEGRGYRTRSRDEVIGMLAEALDVAPDHVVVLPGLPAEGTGHVDLVVLPLDDRTVLVPEIEPKAIKRLRAFTGQLIAYEARGYLDAVALRLQRLGLTVLRVPMLPPLLMPAVDAEPESGVLDAVYFSPANALLTVTPEAHTAWVAYMHDQLFDGRFAALNRQYRRDLSKVLSAHGYAPVFVEATELGRHLGLFRCVTATVPAP